MTDSESTPRKSQVGFVLLCVVCMCGWAMGADASSALVANGSFEALKRLQAPPRPSVKGRWVLKGGLRAPVGWTLSSAFPGQLEIMEGDAADGRRFLRVTAQPRRAAHLFQPWPGVRHGLTYEVSLRYRGGPVELKIYEYDGKGRLKADRPFARGEATPVRSGAWSTLKGVYRMPRSIAKTCLVVAIPAGGEADVDNVRAGRAPAPDPQRAYLSFVTGNRVLESCY